MARTPDPYACPLPARPDQVQGPRYAQAPTHPASQSRPRETLEAALASHRALMGNYRAAAPPVNPHAPSAYPPAPSANYPAAPSVYPPAPSAKYPAASDNHLAPLDTLPESALGPSAHRAAPPANHPVHPASVPAPLPNHTLPPPPPSPPAAAANPVLPAVPTRSRILRSQAVPLQVTEQPLDEEDVLQPRQVAKRGTRARGRGRGQR
ncbi:hypothetical protein DFP72DRAFT_313627 [Ephemerocybe angulata]|uniref:Uncharacterized protein n=1 Tax=Ephemerocybe angulata TaxID=980116 RepID=A0A8H6I0A7_9AGAR|nr:hypothetical protein DFP72DRAFT_313627 [Tulosesus angulatus]